MKKRPFTFVLENLNVEFNLTEDEIKKYNNENKAIKYFRIYQLLSIKLRCKKYKKFTVSSILPFRRYRFNFFHDWDAPDLDALLLEVIEDSFRYYTSLREIKSEFPTLTDEDIETERYTKTPRLIKIFYNKIKKLIEENRKPTKEEWEFLERFLIKNNVEEEEHKKVINHFRTKITEELMEKVWHPKNAHKFEDWGIEL